MLHGPNPFGPSPLGGVSDWAPINPMPPMPTDVITRARVFPTGASRDTDEGKLDFEGFLCPLVLERYAEHMHKNRSMPDGSTRDADNWQKGIGRDVYMKSMWRHFFAVWKTHRKLDNEDIEAELCALMFNVCGMLHEVLKAKRTLPSQP